MSAAAVINAPSDKPKRRVYIRDENGNFVCPICGVVKTRQNTMLYHMDKHEGHLPHECSVCKKGFLQKSELQLHQMKWHPKDDSGVVLCPYPDCNFSDVRKGNVRTHCMRKHVSQYTADIIKRETGVWTCAICDFKSTSAAGFYYHLYGCIVDSGLVPTGSADAELLAQLS
jgi:hypothetical protein